MLFNTNDTLEATHMAANNSLQPSTASKGQDVQLQKQSHFELEAVNDLRMTWKMRWCFFWVGMGLSILWMIAMIGVSLYTLYMTRNLLSLFISAASAPAIEFMRRFANYLLPMEEKQFLLAKKKIELRAQKPASHTRRSDSARWKNHDEYQKSFTRLLRDLKAEAEKIEEQ